MSTKVSSEKQHTGAVRLTAHRAVEGEEGLIHIPVIETHLISSKYVEQTFKVQVMQPAQKQGEARRLPVVYATDANRNFDMLKGISHLIQTSAQDAPPFILVGIGYPGDCPQAGRLLRIRDFTFPPYPQLDVKSIRVLYEGELVAPEGTKDLYGAEDFRRFIGEELIPLIDEKYQTNPGDRTYFGHSGGGFFGLYTLFTQPGLFKNYIVSSPGVIWHGVMPGGLRYENCEFGLQMAKEFVASGKSLDGVKLYMSAGSEEEFEVAIENWRLTSSLQRLAKVLRDAAIPGLELMTEIFVGETHSTVYPCAFIHGVQAMLGTRRVFRSVYC